MWQRCFRRLRDTDVLIRSSLSMLSAMDQRIRDMHEQVKAACTANAARNVRFSPPVHRLSYMMIRVEGADALDVGRLATRNHDCMFFVRNIGGKSALDVYLPLGRTVAVTALRFASNAALAGAAVAAALAVWTMAATQPQRS